MKYLQALRRLLERGVFQASLHPKCLDSQELIALGIGVGDGLGIQDVHLLSLHLFVG